MSGEKLYPSMQEILCDTLEDKDEKKYVNDIVPWMHKDAFGRGFLTLPDSKTMEILHPTEFFRLEGSCSHVKYHLLGQLDSNKVLDSIVKRKEKIFGIYDQICEHFLKLTGTSMMSLVVKLVLLSKFDSSDRNCSRGIIELLEIKQKFIQRKLIFPDILYVAVFLMMLEAKSVVKDKITLMVNEKYLDITLEEVILTYTSYARDLEMSKQTEKEIFEKKPQVGKVKIKNEVFEKCKQGGK